MAKTVTLYRRAKSLLCLTTAFTLMAGTAFANGFQVNVRDCPSAKGTISVDTSNVMAWDSVKSKNPTSLVKSMIMESSCFNMDEGASYTPYKLRFGPLTPQEFAQGPSNFSGRSVLEPAPAVSGGIPQAGGIPQSDGGIPQAGSSSGDGFGLNDASSALLQAERAQRGVNNAEYYSKNLGRGVNDLGDARRGINSLDGALSSLGGLAGLGGGSKKSNDKYAYVEVLDGSGQVLARGFGQNNRHDLDFSHWSYDAMGVDNFSSKKDSRRAGGALYNAFNDAQNRIMSPSFGAPIQ